MAQNPDDESGFDTLQEVSLKFFTAKPDQIAPFGASLLEWQVEGPATGFHVKLSGTSVPRRGQLVVRPKFSSTYLLTAVAGSQSKRLGSAQVVVNLSGCETYPILNPDLFIRSALKSNIQSSPEYYLNSIPVVTFTLGWIQFNLDFKARVDSFPDPTIKINASFGLGVQDDHLIPLNEQIGVGVSFPFYAWLILGAPFILPGKVNEAREAARLKAPEIISSIVQLLDINSVGADPKAVKHSVRIGVSETGAGTLDITECPNDLLARFAEISGVIVATKL